MKAHLVSPIFAGIAAASITPPTGRGCLVVDDGAPLAPKVSLLSVPSVPENITVDVNFHLSSTPEHENLITSEIANAQWNVLQQAFAKYDIHLRLNSTTRVVDDIAGRSFLRYEGPELGWVNYDEERKAFFKNSRLGGYDALNIHFFSDYSPGATGYCTFPTVIDGSDDFAFGQDACQLSAMTMPGITAEQGAFEAWNLGHLAVHEAGHWFGLNHTFAGGCSEPGDFVADTPAQQTQIYGCPVGSDSCPDSIGLDPIHNYMGYTDDNCTSEFTEGQRERMLTTFEAYRAGA
ncbi:metalloprotease [Emericellopsis atlantica]|uniref:Metalloprotease n=1 Tax=Emericellopsis atlantica TaxID=2614577 RepID=A0A9P7ZRA6_9HYPO|nr:metalloprotease [Emericellopsis atlantica]KAG9256879.1 metalloprotease [Emericellopsis atlantica]